MRILVRIIGVLLIIFGAVWILQGINVLPGSFMTGQTRWAVFGGVAFIVGVVLVGVATRGKGSRPKKIV
jgi:hypothetical protein